MAGPLRANTSVNGLSNGWSDSGWSDSPVSHPDGAGLPPFAPVRGDGSEQAQSTFSRRVFASSGSLLSGGGRDDDAPPRSRQLGSESPVMFAAMLPQPPPPLLLSRAPAASAPPERAAPTLAEIQADIARLSTEAAPADDAAADARRMALEEIAHKLAALQSNSRAPTVDLLFGRPGGAVPRDSRSGVVVARSWEELHHFLFLDSWDDRIGKHRLRHVFRGMTQARAHKLQTSIQRLGDIEHIHTVEPGMIRAFRKYAVPEFSSHGTMRDATVWEWLTVAQHHGLPTRLLDWTHNPMIAAHFVTDRPEDLGTDGAIWCVDPAELNARSEEFRRWNLARPQGAKVLGLFTIEQLEEYCLDNAPRHARPGSRISSLEMFDATQLRCAFLEPPSIDARLVHQQGLFSVLSPEADMEALLLSHPACARKIIVPSWLKREVRDKLDAIGVSERTLFPGLDGLCTWLRRYYTKGMRETRPSRHEHESHDEGGRAAAGAKAAAPQSGEAESRTLAADSPGKVVGPDVVYVERAYARRSSVAWGDGL